VAKNGLIWTPYSDENAEEVTGRLETILKSWKGTPYSRGQRCKGMGVDCVRFICSVLDELEGLEPRPPRSLPADESLKYPKSARASIKRLLAPFRPYYTITDKRVEPGDVLVTGPIAGGPGHVIIVGPRKGTVWQAVRPRVHITGMGYVDLPYMKLYRVLRRENRSKLWVKMPEH